MTARLCSLVLVIMSVAGFALLGSSVQGVADIDRELRSSVRAVPVEDERRDCPFPKPAREV